MSAPIPSFFKIRFLLVILSFLLFFMLIGMTRRALAVDCTDYDYDVNYYTTIVAARAARDATVTTTHRPFTTRSYVNNYWYLCYKVLPLLDIYASYHYEFQPDGSIIEVGFAAVFDPSCEDSDGDGNCECGAEKESLASQCGAVGYTMIDEENCKGRCNDCVQEAEAQCPAPSFIVWNEDGDCSYNCSPDSDGDGWPDIDDPDDDNDGVPDDDDPCSINPDPSCVRPSGPDSDGDGTPDGSDPDADPDNDGVPNDQDDDDDGDGIPDVSDADADPDGDGIMNIYDDDDDGDGIPDVDDPDADPDGDGKINNEDPDDDNDGVIDSEDPDNTKYSSNELSYSYSSNIGQQFIQRFNAFIDQMESSSIFSIPGQIFGSGGIPTGGSPIINYNGGEYLGGEQVINLSNWSSGLAVMRSALYVLFAAVAIKIALLGR